MHEIESWIDEAVQRQKIIARKLPTEEAIQVQNEVTSRYVHATSPRTWWWHFKRPVDEYYDRNLVKLLDVVPTKSGLCWLIPDTETEWLPVYEIDIRQVGPLIDDCPGFEYYVVALDFSWLVVETHHDQYQLCRESDKLREVVS